MKNSLDSTYVHKFGLKTISASDQPSVSQSSLSSGILMQLQSNPQGCMTCSSLVLLKNVVLKCMIAHNKVTAP